MSLIERIKRPFNSGVMSDLRMKILFLIPLLLAFLGQPVFAQQNTVTICVKDARDDANLQDATAKVITGGRAYSGQTGADGCAEITGNIPVPVDELPPVGNDLVAGTPYPNPASNQVILPIYTDFYEQPAVAIYDLQGRQVEVSAKLQPGIGGGFAFEADLSQLAHGVYLYRVESEGRVVRGKFVKGAANARPVAVSIRSGTVATKTNSQVPVTVEISKNGFVTHSEERTLFENETIRYNLFKMADGLIPIMDMYGEKYLGLYLGGLYPDQQNQIPEPHLAAGLARAREITPLDVNGNPAANGKIVVTSIGMSTTSSIFCGVADPNDPCKDGSWMRTIQNDNEVSNNVVVIDGADPGKTADKWQDPEESAFKRIKNEELDPFGYSEQQVQVAWVNLASSGPTHTLPAAEANAFELEEQYGNVMRALRTRYPNLKLIFFASRVYAGYATGSLNPEPFAYESGFAVKWLIEAQINQMHGAGNPVDAEAGDLNFNSQAPWLAWGPYLWANGTTPRSDGLVWLQEDLKQDGTHLNRPGILKVSAMLSTHFKTSRLTRCWFVENGQACE